MFWNRWRKAQPNFAANKSELSLSADDGDDVYGIYPQPRIVYIAQRVEEAPNGGQRNTNL